MIAKQPKKIITNLRLHRGAPTIFVNGQPIHGGFVGTRGSNDLLGAHPEGIAPLSYKDVDYQMIFIGPDGEYDTSGMEKDFAEIFENYPQALGGLVLGMRPTRDWIAANLGEMPVAAWPIDWMTNNRPDASWASEVWRRDSARAVAHIAGRLHRTFNGRIIFYQIGAGRCGENGPQITIDYSEPLLRHLRAWLRNRYGSDVEALRQAWSNPAVTFETATPPAPVEQMSTEWFTFRSPLRRQTADYLQAYADCVESNILLWMESVKQATNNEALTASPSASVLDAGLNADLHAHLPKNTVRGYIDSPHLDMVQSPASYGFRDLGRGDTTTLQPMGSVQLAGKMQLRDYDDRTHLTAWRAEEFPKCRLWETPKDAWGDEQLMLRNTAYSLIKNGAFWWHELDKKMFSHPDHVRIVKRLQAVGRATVHADRRMPEHGLAIFVQTQANFLQSSSNRLIFSMNYEARQLQWAHAGMAANIFILEDAGHPDMPSPKVIMVTNAFTMSTAEADAVKALARKNGAAIVWLVAPGVQQPGGFDLEHTSRITGFKIRALDIETLPRITMRQNSFGTGPGTSPIFEIGCVPVSRGERSLSDISWPDERPVSSFGGGQMDYDDAGARGTGPIFYADVEGDPGATVLGDLDFVFKPGLVARECDGYRSIYCAAPYMHKALLRQLGHEGGAHVYLDSDDLVHASRELLVVNARRPGLKMLRWPCSSEVVMDIYSGKLLAANTDRWEVEMKKYETRFFFAGPAEVAAQITASLADSRCGLELL